VLPTHSLEQKKSTLIHELTHKVLPRNYLMKESELENHKVLDLILYDIWTELYGKEFADNSVEGEHSWSDIYVQAWGFALGFTKEEREEKYKNFTSNL
jgi:hypothetical protein